MTSDSNRVQPSQPSDDRPSEAVTRGAATVPLLPPLNAVLELAAFALVAAAVKWAAPALDITALDPNPCWLPVLLLSAQYGPVAGLLAAGAAIAFTGFEGFAEQDVGENLFVYLLRVWGQPMLWIATALILGQFRMRQLAERRRLLDAVEALTRERAIVGARAIGLRNRVERLERDAAGRVTPEALTALSALSRGLDGTAGRQAALQAALSALSRDAAASLYLTAADASPVLVTRAGPAASDALTPPAELIAAVAQGRNLTVLTAEGERLLGGAGIAAVPVWRDRAVVGVLVLEHIAPDLVRPELADALVAIAHAVLASGDDVRLPRMLVPISAVAPPTPTAATPRRRTSWARLLFGLGGRE